MCEDVRFSFILVWSGGKNSSVAPRGGGRTAISLPFMVIIDKIFFISLSCTWFNYTVSSGGLNPHTTDTTTTPGKSDCSELQRTTNGVSLIATDGNKHLQLQHQKHRLD